jgi:hypothetical protein
MRFRQRSRFARSKSGQREGIAHYNLICVTRALNRVSEGQLKSAFGTLWMTLRLKHREKKIFPNVVELLREIHAVLTRTSGDSVRREFAKRLRRELAHDGCAVRLNRKKEEQRADQIPLTPF